MEALLLLSLATLLIVPVALICYTGYEDGVFGRVALSMVAFFAGIFLLGDMLYGYELMPETVCLIGSFAGFFVWHLLRFHRRIVRTERAKRGELERRRCSPSQGGAGG